LWFLWRGRDPMAMARVRESVAEFRALVVRHRKFCTVMPLDQGLNAFSHNIPIFLLGGLLGTAAAGHFAMANALVAVPVYLMIGAVGRITLPALAGRPEADIRHRILLT